MLENLRFIQNKGYICFHQLFLEFYYGTYFFKLFCLDSIVLLGMIYYSACAHGNCVLLKIIETESKIIRKGWELIPFTLG